MTRVQQIATLILDMPFGELRELASYIHGLESDLDDIARLYEAAQNIPQPFKDAGPSQDPMPTPPLKYPYSGVKYDLGEMYYGTENETFLPVYFIWSRTPQGDKFWLRQSVQITPEGQSYLDEMKAQYEREQKDDGECTD